MLVEAPDGTMQEFCSQEWRERTDFTPSPVDPLAEFLPFLDRAPDWVIIGGLGNGDEIVWVRKHWPHAKVLGIDPDQRALDWQLDHGWPMALSYPLLKVALSDSCGRELMCRSTICCASLHPSCVYLADPDDLQWVCTKTLDSLDARYGPLTNALLCLDLESYDYKALCGAPKLLASGRVPVLGVEVRYEQHEEWKGMQELLTGHGYRHVRTWFRQWWGHNEIWKRG